MIRKIFSDYAYWVSFICLFILAVCVNTNFLRWTNITNLFVQASVTGIIALGMTMVISAGQIDISVGAQIAIISGFGINFLNRFNNLWLMLLFCVAFGSVVGIVNGLLVAKGKMPAMVATLATMSICRSLVNHFGQGGPYTVNDANFESFRKVAAGNIEIFGLRIPYPMIMFIITAILFGIIMRKTKLGKHIYAVGSNTLSAKLAGVNVQFIQIIVFVITGALTGFASWIYSSRLMAVAAASAGLSYEMDVIAAVAIGGTSMSGGRGKIIGSFLGALMFKMISNILTMANFPTFLNGAISGGIIIVAVLLQNVQNKN